MASADTGWTESAKPVASEVMTNPRRLHCERGNRPSNPLSTASIASSLGEITGRIEHEPTQAKDGVGARHAAVIETAGQ
jgi:hypothetical protein